MKIDDVVKTVNKNRVGKIIDVYKTEGFSDQFVVLLENGKRIVFLEQELEVIDV